MERKAAETAYSSVNRDRIQVIKMKSWTSWHTRRSLISSVRFSRVFHGIEVYPLFATSDRAPLVTGGEHDSTETPYRLTLNDFRYPIARGVHPPHSTGWWQVNKLVAREKL